MGKEVFQNVKNTLNRVCVFVGITLVVFVCKLSFKNRQLTSAEIDSIFYFELFYLWVKPEGHIHFEILCILTLASWNT